MKTDFANGFADFLEERLGNSLFTLRQDNEEYRKLSDRRDALLNEQHQNVEEYRQALADIAEVSNKLGDIAKRYLFLAGMREHARMEDALSSEAFEKLFAGLK